jgi:hypothetical protein
MHQKHLQLLELLVETTHSGRAAWRRETTGIHRTELAGIPCSLRFKPPLSASGAHADGDAVEVTLGATTLTFWAGSEGYDLVEDILAAAYPEVMEETQTMARRLDAVINRIQAAAA